MAIITIVVDRLHSDKVSLNLQPLVAVISILHYVYIVLPYSE